MELHIKIYHYICYHKTNRMKLTIDTTNKTVELWGDENLSAVLNVLKIAAPNDWNLYTIKVPVYNYSPVNPIIYPWTYPDNPYLPPFTITYTDSAGSTAPNWCPPQGQA